MHANRTYDHRIREAIVRTGNPKLFPQLNIPRSTARAWIRRGERDVVTLEPTTEHALRVYLSKVEAQLVVLRQVMRLLLTRVRLSSPDASGRWSDACPLPRVDLQADVLLPR